MVHEVELANLTPQHRNEYHRIYCCDDKESVLLEDRKWMPPFVGRDHPSPETKILYVRVPSCDDATLQLIRQKLGVATAS